MRKILLFLTVLCLAVGLSFAQNNKPSELVRVEKENQSSFEPVRLFETQVNQRLGDDVPQELQGYTLFSLDLKKAGSLRSAAPETMTFELPGTRPMSLELVKVDLTTDGFYVKEMPSGKILSAKGRSTHYRGIVKDDPGSIVALSIMDDEVTGIVSSREQSGNIVIGKMKNSARHIMYRDADISHLNDFACKALDSNEVYPADKLSSQSANRQASRCPEVFFDIGNDIVRDKGGSTAAANFVESIFNQVAVLYANENVTIKLSGMTAWTSSTPFSGINDYRSYRNRNSFNGDLGHFVTYNFSGGVAWVNALCGSRNYAVSGIRRTFSNVPTYSWSVEVVAHELGHNLGSQHTHACVWNGNGTAIDGCSTTEGGCGRPGVPSGGGTIMSYCHLTNVGINFSKGFGTQPGNIIRSRINAASCVQRCDGGGGGDICDGVPAWDRNTNYSVGDRVVFSGQLFEWTGSTWTSLGECGNNDPCFGVAAWSASVNYGVGDLVVNQGYLFEWTGSTWKQLEACGASVQAATLTTEKSLDIVKDGFIVFPNPATGEEELTVKGTVPVSSASRVMLLDMSGRIIRSVELLQNPHGDLQQSIKIGDLEPGAYFIQVIGIHKTFTEKVIIR